MKLSFLTIFTFILIYQPLFASDHIDGVPSLSKHEQVDLTDLYIFQNGQEKRDYSIVLNLYPGVGEAGHFSSKVQYNIILRPAFLSGENSEVFKTVENQSVVINCSFTDPGHHNHSHESSKVRCEITKQGLLLNSVSATVGEIKESDNGNLKVYTGVRSDSFFITREHFEGVTERKEFISKKVDDNLMESINVLSIALEVNMSELFKENSLPFFAIAAESFTAEGGVKEVLDRVGRPEITNLSLHSFGDSEKLKLKYNSVNAFSSSEQYQGAFKHRLITNISSYDSLDGKDDWNYQSLGELTDLLLEDYLVVSASKNCESLANDFLEIEKSILRGEMPIVCGGRKLTDDIMNTLYSLYIGGLNGDMTQFLSGVTEPYQSSSKELSDSFPYLAKPEADSFLNFKQILLNKFMKKNQD